MIKKLTAEFIGTMTLVLLGCGTAMLVGCDAASGSGYLLTALAFGLAIVAMAYSIGNVSGCHVNPAVSLAVWLHKGLKMRELIAYVIAQCLGAIAGSALLSVLFHSTGIKDMTGGYAANGMAGVGQNPVAALLVEAVLTFIFVTAILGVTDKDRGHGSFAGLIIGLTLVVVHIIGIGLTGTSVNPARSLGPAIIQAVNGQKDALQCLGVFIAGPISGSALAAVVYGAIRR